MESYYSLLYSLVSIVIIYLFIMKIAKYLFRIPRVPILPETDWWGPRKQDSIVDGSIREFQINIKDEVINDLRCRLKNIRPLTPSLDVASHEYGINSNLIGQVVNYWLTEYKWDERQKFLNQYPQYKTNIQGLDIHFIHVKPKNPGSVPILPLLLLHGWPGSVREFYEILPILTTPQPGRKFVFEVIAPSLPGYGFSDPAVRPGLGPSQMAVIFKNLMLRLKFNKFYMQAGDWGSIIMTHMAILFPEHVLAIHSNMCVDISIKSLLKRFLYGFWPSLIVDKKYEHRVYPIKKFFAGLIRNTGYYHIQATKPDTIGAAFDDSPMGLAAYILEKFIDKNGHLTKKFTMEMLLDNVMIYWVTNSMTTSMRLYAEAHKDDVTSPRLRELPVLVPTGYGRFVHDIVYFPEALLTDRYPNLIHVSDLDGGHFAALECPNTLANDIFDFIEKVLKLQEKP